MNVFEIDGTISQFKYAKNATEFGSLAIGLATYEGVILAAEKRMPSSLVIPSSAEKILGVSRHLGCAVSGFMADALALIEYGRADCVNHWFQYDEQMPISSCVTSISKYMTRDCNGTFVLSRPYAVNLLFAGIDRSTPELWYMDPSGAYAQYKFKAIGLGSREAADKLRFEFCNEMPLEKAKFLVLETLKNVMEEPIKCDNFDFMTLTKEEIFKLHSKKEKEAILAKLPS